MLHRGTHGSPQSPIQRCPQGSMLVQGWLQRGLVHGWWQGRQHRWWTQAQRHGNEQTSHASLQGLLHGLWPQCSWQRSLHAGHDSPQVACNQQRYTYKNGLSSSVHLGGDGGPLKSGMEGTLTSGSFPQVVTCTWAFYASIWLLLLLRAIVDKLLATPNF